ncbi:histidinol-phosphate aminotransferase [Phycomyces blakesleeanus]|uniref:histidinol-phosphate transaminase n=1 Tax=Phycomyces blakesleeanus TaxID=4837 RepID=A0ABR3B7U3_PHYBL
MPFNIEKVIRPNILALAPYRCARDDYSKGVLLDANENAFGSALPIKYKEELNRYPDPYHPKIKERIVKLRNVSLIRQVFLGVGSDEVIDLLIRVTCTPGKDKILTTPPTYGMYSVSAQVNDVGVVHSNLNIENGLYQLRLDDITASLKNNPEIKVVFLCSPGNPTGTALSHDSIREILKSGYEGIVVVDEAYVDFVDHENGTVSSWIDTYPNLVVIQTLSKSFGLAGIRLGIALGNPDLIQILNNTKAPYNIGTPAASIAYEALSDVGLATMNTHRSYLIRQRSMLVQRLLAFPLQGLGRILGANDANFILVEILDKNNKPCNVRAGKVYSRLADCLGVVIRLRCKEYGCFGCVRITVGTEQDNEYLLDQLEIALKSV